MHKKTFLRSMTYTRARKVHAAFDERLAEETHYDRFVTYERDNYIE